MTVVRPCARVGAAAVALGLTLGGPAVGLAAADSGGRDGRERGEASAFSESAPATDQPEPADSALTTGAPDQRTPEPDSLDGPPAVTEEPEQKEPEAGPAEEPEITDSAAAPTAQAAVPHGGSAIGIVTDKTDDSGREPDEASAVDSAVAPERGGDRPRPFWRSATVNASVPGELPVAIPAELDSPGPAELPQPVLALGGALGGPVPGFARPAPAPGMSLGTASFTVRRAIDGLGTWLSGLPGGAITDFLAGGLWLARRTLFPVGSDVGVWGSAACTATGDCSGQDLGGANLYGQDLAGVNFAGASLRKADLGAARLTVANLTGTALTGANLGDASLNGAALASADLAGAAFAGARLVNADLGGANLTGANLTGADLTGANLSGATLTDVTFRGTTCPDGTAASGGCAALPEQSADNKPGLLASDRLFVHADTGESWWAAGDEPILYTAYLTATLGKDGSADVAAVNSYPGEIAENMKSGSDAYIQDRYGDQWINYNSNFKPLTFTDLTGALQKGEAVPIPILATVTLALEGDLSPAGLMGGLGTLITSRLRTIGEVVESTPIVVGTGVDQVTITNGGSGYTSAPTVKFTGGRPDPLTDFGQPAKATAIVTNGTVTGVTIDNAGSQYNGSPGVEFEGGGGTGAQGTAVMKAQGTIKDQASRALEIALNTTIANVKLNWLEWAGVGLLQLWSRWLSLGDPDDPVGISATVLIPVDSSVVNVLDPTLLGLDGRYTKLYDFDEKNAGAQPYYLRTTLFDTNIQVRLGLLVPGDSFTDGQPQYWNTEYAGDFTDNDWARWRVVTKAWSRTTW